MGSNGSKICQVEQHPTLPGNSNTNQEPRLSIDAAHLSASEPDKGNNPEEYYRRMVEENPSNSLVLRNYAQFLYQVRYRFSASIRWALYLCYS